MKSEKRLKLKIKPFSFNKKKMKIKVASIHIEIEVLTLMMHKIYINIVESTGCWSTQQIHKSKKRYSKRLMDAQERE